MKLLSIPVTLTILFCACQQTQNNAADEAAIKARFETFAAAWNNQDAKTMAASYAESGSLIDPFGTEARGHIAIEGLLGKTVNIMLQDSETSFTIEHVRFLRQDAVFVDAIQHITGSISPEGMKIPAMRLHVAAVMQKNAGQWLFVDARPYQFMPQSDEQMSAR